MALLGPDSESSTFTENPDPRIRSYLTEHAAELGDLRKIVEDRSATSLQRSQALRRLSLLSGDAAIELAARLINDSTLSIVEEAIDILSSEIVANGHGRSSESSSTNASSGAWAGFIKAQHSLVLDALRTATDDSRPEVSKLALKALVRISDQYAVRKIRDAARAGQISELDAVKLCSQASGVEGRACLLDYLNEGSIEAKVLVVTILGSIPEDRSMIRNKVFFNSNSDPKLRVAAAETLGNYDPAFLNYALTITADPTTPPNVYAATLKGYATSAQLKGKLNSVQWNAINKALENKVMEIQKTAKIHPTKSGH